MKTINLIKPDQSEVSFRIDRFPDGEVQFVLTEELNRKETYTVDCRITNAEELFLLLQVGDVLDRQAVVWDLHIRYLMGMRMDRVMSFERPFTLRIVGKMISQMNYRDCGIETTHSSRTLEEIRDSYNIDELAFRFKMENGIDMAVETVYPDRGALDRYGNMTGNEVYFEKERDVETGRIKSFRLMNDLKIFNPSRFLFYDDLCDAGGTFLGELKILKEKYPDAKFDIRVAHIVNEVGLDHLCQNFDTVYTTESYRDWGEVAKAKGYTNLIIK
jgi:phosphoribosylpyrophosphate synthetase